MCLLTFKLVDKSTPTCLPTNVVAVPSRGYAFKGLVLQDENWFDSCSRGGNM